jgi:hypothetical protein
VLINLVWSNLVLVDIINFRLQITDSQYPPAYSTSP